MKHFRSLLFSALAASLLIAGCGGEGSLSPTGTFTIPIGNPTADFSGDRSPFVVTDGSYTVDGRHLSVSLSGRGGSLDRKLVLDALTDSDIAVGTSIDLSQGRNVLTYSESNRAAGDVFRANQGTVTVRGMTSDLLTVEFRNVKMVPLIGNEARGSFTINGTYSIPKSSVPPVDENGVNLTFTGNGNISMDPMKFVPDNDTNTLEFIMNNRRLEGVAEQTMNANTSRNFSVTLEKTPSGTPINVGDVFPVMQANDGKKATVTLAEIVSPDQSVKMFSSDEAGSGTVTVTSLNADRVTLRFNGVKMNAQNAPAYDQSSGSITVNGTVSGQFSHPQ